MNKRAQEALQPQAVAGTDSKKIIIMAAVAVVIILLAVGAYLIFKQKAQEPAAEGTASGEEALNDLSADMTADEQAGAEQALDDLSADTTEEDRQNAEAVLASL